MWTKKWWLSQSVRGTLEKPQNRAYSTVIKGILSGILKRNYKSKMSVFSWIMLVFVD